MDDEIKFEDEESKAQKAKKEIISKLKPIKYESEVNANLDGVGGVGKAERNSIETGINCKVSGVEGQKKYSGCSFKGNQCESVCDKVNDNDSIKDECKQIALYIHIPFCQRKCNYCSFVSFCDKADKIDLYLDCLIKEMQIKKREVCGGGLGEYQIKSIYIGGGTPSLLSEAQIKKLFNAIYENFEVEKDAEITIEVNPNSVSKEKLEAYKSVKINRISVGVQSLNGKELEKLGRLHNEKVAIEALKLIKECGFTNVNCDLMFGLKGFSVIRLKMWIRKLKQYVTHFSIYSLMIEENTPFFVEYENGGLQVLSEKQSAKAYKSIVKTLQKWGYHRYEVSNFATAGFESKHNKTYWELGDYMGLGIASHSFISGERIANTEKFDDYINALSDGKLCNCSEFIDADKLKEEFIMLALRESAGIDLEKFDKTFNCNLLEDKKREIQLLKTLKLVEVAGNHLYATDEGFLVLNQIILKLI